MENKNLDNYLHKIKKLERCLPIWNIIILTNTHEQARGVV